MPQRAIPVWLEGAFVMLIAAVRPLGLHAQTTQAGPPSDSTPTIVPPFGSNNAHYVVAFVLLGALVFLVQSILFWRMKTVSADDILKSGAVIIILVATVILIIGGYNTQQVTPAIGLFGSLLGYLLGRSSRKPERAEKGRASNSLSKDAEET
jgi:multisubunit Na+/H+ antiporter MnhG subunit